MPVAGRQNPIRIWSVDTVSCPGQPRGPAPFFDVQPFELAPVVS
jgi:hypothetical protein